MSDTDSIARLGRAVAVTLVAATQRPTQKAMGQGAVRSQMDTRICFRVRERRDVDLVLGQGMLAAGWNAHALNAPGKFLVSAPEHTTPRRARAYLVTDDDVARTAGRYARSRPALDDVSRAALRLRRASRTGTVVPPKPPPRRGRARRHPGRFRYHHARRRALGRSVRGTRGRSRHRRPHAGQRHGTFHAVPLPRPARPAGRALQVGWGRWRATTPGAGSR